jgi:RNA polymerase sigma factor (sigma-70 family)
MTNAKYYTPKYAISTFIGLQVRSALAAWAGHSSRTREDAVHHSESIGEEHDRPEESDEDDEVLDELKDRLGPYLSLLGHNERAVLIDYLWRGLSINSIAERLGFHNSSVSTIKTRAVDKIRRALDKGKRVSHLQQVDVDLPLEHAVKQLPDVLYHSYRLRRLRGLPLARVANLMGRSVPEVNTFVEEARAEIAIRWGYRA